MAPGGSCGEYNSMLVPPYSTVIVVVLISVAVMQQALVVHAFFLDLERFSSDHQCLQDLDCNQTQYCDESPLNNYVPFKLFGDSLFRRECEEKKELVAVCLRDEMCMSSKCEMGRCVECKVDSDCPPGTNMYCGGSVQWALTQVDSFFGFGLGRSFANFLNPEANTCAFPKEFGDFCLRDLECQSGACDLAQCGDNSTRECYVDRDCIGGEFCAGADNGLERNRCAMLGREGDFCRLSAHCESGSCSQRQCLRDPSAAATCRSDNHCPEDHFCFPSTTLFGRSHTCRRKGGLGSSCGADSHCLPAAPRCENRRCGECLADTDCDLRLEFCGRRGLTRLCQKKKCRGFCSAHSSCVSGVCSLFLCEEPRIPCEDSQRKKSESFADSFGTPP